MLRHQSVKKNSLLAILLIGILAFTGLGCKSTQQAEQAAAVKPAQLEYWTVYDDVDQLKALAAAFQAERPHISITIRQLRPEELYQRLIEELAEDRGPDIVSLRNRSLPLMRSKLATMPLEVPDNRVISSGSSFDSKSTVVPGARRLLTVPQLVNEYVPAVAEDVVFDNQIYGLPLSLDSLAVYYNRDILDRAGIPEVPKTWSELQAAVQKISKIDKDGKILQSGVALGTGNNIPGADDILFTLFEQNRLSFVDKAGRPTFQLPPRTLAYEEQPPAYNILNFYADFANPAAETYSWSSSLPSALDAFTNGSLAFFFGYNYHLPVIKARAPQLNFGIIPLFQIDPDRARNVANYWVQTVTKKSPDQEAAWAFIDYIAHSPATKEYLDKTERPTALRTYVGTQLENPNLFPFVTHILVARNWYKGTNYEAAVKALSDMINEWQVPLPEGQEPGRWYQAILNRAAAKIDQTF